MSYVMNSELPSLAERIGGRWSISKQKWLITLCLMPLLAAGYTKNLGDAHSVFLWSSFAFAGLFLVGVVDFVLGLTLFRSRHQTPVPVWWVVADAAFGGLVIGACAWVGGWLGGANDLTQMAIRIPGLMMLGALWGVMLTLILDYRERVTISREKYIDEMVYLELAKEQQSAIVADVIQTVHRETEKEIARIREELEGLSANEASAVLRTSATEAIQPMSKRLWESAKNSYPTVRIRDVLSHSVREQSFQPWSLAILTVALSVVDRMDRIGEARGLVVTLLIAACVVIQLSLANKAMLMWPVHRLALFLSTIVVVELQTSSIVVWERRVMSLPVSYAELVVSVLASLFLIFLTVGIRSFDLLSGEVVRFATMGIESERISSIARDRHIGAVLQDMARTLHGTVQTRLVSCAMALDLAAQANDGESANAALLEARRVLSEAAVMPKSELRSISDEVNRKVAVWSGLCECTVHVDADGETLSVTERIGQIVEEGITNAVRHGGASAVEVVVTQQPDGFVVVTIADNGFGPLGGQRGVGSAIIDMATGGNWSLSRGTTGAMLEARILS